MPEETEKHNILEEKLFLLERIERAFQIYLDVLHEEKDGRSNISVQHLSSIKEVRNNIVAAAAFVATLAVASLPPSPERNPLLDIVRADSYFILFGAIVSAVGFFIGMNAYMYLVAIRHQAIINAYWALVASMNTLREIINYRSMISFKSVQAKQLYLFSQLMLVAFQNRTILFNAFKLASTTFIRGKEGYEASAFLQRYMMNDAYNIYFRYRNGFYEERGFLKEALHTIASLVKEYNEERKILRISMTSTSVENINQPWMGTSSFKSGRAKKDSFNLDLCCWNK